MHHQGQPRGAVSTYIGKVETAKTEGVAGQVHVRVLRNPALAAKRGSGILLADDLIFDCGSSRVDLHVEVGHLHHQALLLLVLPPLLTRAILRPPVQMISSNDLVH